MRNVLALVLVATAATAVIAIPAAANTVGSNGRIVFTRFDPALDDDFVYTANPDGSQERQLLPTGAEGPRWSPDGSRIVVGPHDVDNVSARIVNPDNGSYRDLANPDPDRFFLPCSYGPWSPDGQRLTCEAFGNSDASVNGIYTIRSSDGGGLERITANPGGEDCAGDYAPNGKRLVFLRASDDVVALFTVKVDGSGLRQISPSGSDEFFINFECGNWSPQGNDILFSAHVPDADRATVWTVHADGSDLREIPIQGCGGLRSSATSVGCFNARWSPDGTKIIFNRLQAQAGEDIYTVNADGTGLAPAVTNQLNDDGPDWGTHPLLP